MKKSETKNSKIETLELLPTNKSREFLNHLDDWKETDDHKMIYREFIFHDFIAAIDMIDHIAVIAEDEKHHPDIHLTQYRNLRVALTTHDVGGLSDKDFAVASKINDLPFSKEHQQLQYKRQTSKMSLETKIQPKKIKSISAPAKKRNKKKETPTKKAANRVNQHIKKT